MAVLLSLLSLGLLPLQSQELPDTLASYPWGVSKTYDQATGTYQVVNQEMLEKRALGDLRNRFTGMIPGLIVTENGGSFFSAASGNFTNYYIGSGAYDFRMKGFSNIVAIVDDVVVPFNQIMLEPNQIESITVLSDVADKAKYGPLASSGALYIKTKRGGYNTPLQINVNVESGVNMIDRLPEWVSGVDYVRMNAQARESAGMLQVFPTEYVDEYKKYQENDQFFPCVDYKSKMLRNAFSTTSYAIDATGGGKNIKYAFAINGLNSGDIVKAETADYNRLNLSANVSTKIGRYVEASAGFIGLLSFRRSGTGSWNDYRKVPEVAFPLVIDVMGDDGELSLEAGRNIYGVSKTWENNYYAKLKEGGFLVKRNRSGLFNFNLDVDFSWLLKGLKSKTFLQTSSFLYTNIGKKNDYIAYYWDPQVFVTDLSDHKGVTMTSRSTYNTATSQSFSLYERLYYDWAKSGHKIDAGVTYYMQSAAQTDDAQYQKQLYFVGDLSWSYDDRYAVEIAAQYAGSSRFKNKARFGFFPTIGASWTISNEEFMKDVDVVNNIKLHAQVGDIGTSDIFGSHYLYQANYSTSSGMNFGPATLSGVQWFGSNVRTSQPMTITRLQNEDLTWARIFQIDAGIDVDLLNCLHLYANYYRWNRRGIIVDIMDAIPSLYGTSSFSVYGNHESRITQGFDLAASFSKTFNGVGINLGASLSHWNQKYDKLVSDLYNYEYQKKEGTSIYSIWGYECIGKYESYEQINELPSYVSKTDLEIGDLIYKDKNEDGKIDLNDREIIGRSEPKLAYAINFGLTWKNLDFSMVGTGMAGHQIKLTDSDYFVGGDGDANYSAFIRDELGGAYPRLSYNEIPNNKIVSTFWLRDASWFKLQSVQIGYKFDFSKRNIFIKSLRVNIKGENLATISKVKYVDPEAFSAGLGNYPLFRMVTAGLKIEF